MSVWCSPEFDQHEQVCFFSDPASGLQAIVAIHSTALGPAVGGTRFRAYATVQDAVDDALRLSRAMSYKSALAGLPFGGGKAVIVGDPARLKTDALLRAYGGFLNRIGDVFATGEDVGLSVRDCEVIREATPFVGGTESAGAGDPGVHTAEGVFHGLRAVLKARFGASRFEGVHISLQGLGAVGWRLCERLHAAGARLTVSDLRAERVQRAQLEFGVAAVNPGEAHSVEADIYAPCALGAVITEESIRELRAPAVAGAANNQLAQPEMGALLHGRGVLFAPDYVINAGGVIGSAEEMIRMPGRSLADGLAPLDVRLAAIETRLLTIFDRAAAEQTPPEVTAARWAREILAGASSR